MSRVIIDSILQAQKCNSRIVDPANHSMLRAVHKGRPQRGGVW